MTGEECDAFLRAPRIATLVTLRSDGSPSAVPVWYEWDGVQAQVFTSRTSGKVRRIQHDPRACLSVAEPVGAPEAWVTIEGTATIEEAGAIDLARRLARRYYDPDKAARALREWERRAGRLVIVRLAPHTVRSSAPG